MGEIKDLGGWSWEARKHEIRRTAINSLSRLFLPIKNISYVKLTSVWRNVYMS
jgi:hypothetical protein